MTLAVALTCVAVIGVVVATRLSDLSQNGRTLTQQVQPAEAAASALTLAVLDVEFTSSRYALSSAATDRAAVDSANQAATRAAAKAESTTQADPDSSAAAALASAAYTRWYDDVVKPSVAAIAAGDRDKARQEVTNPEAITTTDNLRTALAGLDTSVLTWRAAAVAGTADALAVLRGALGSSLAVLLVLVGVLWIGLRRWVTDPLDRLATDLRQVRDGDLEHPIGATGPPDLAATARDAEEMRQRLVKEIDEAVAAREALDQRGPVVAALRRELRATSTSQIPGLETAGLLVPAEGVLAGDWFSTVVLSDGRLAVLMVDVSGHGPLAGLMALKLKYAMTAAVESGGGPRAAIEAGAGVLAHESEQFATAVVLTVTGTGEVTWCNAGHPAPTILGRRATSDRLGPTGPVLSGLGGTWTLGKARMASDATLLVVSDGLLESRDADGVELAEAWGDSRLAALVRDAPSMRGAIEAIAAAARERADRWRVDDLTIVGLRRNAG